MARTHIVLVPGFVGFDGLGQLAYYAGTTELFNEWKTRVPSPRATAAVLHYFDNFPTASVATRAHRLGEFLNKKIARGEIAADDQLSLVGHSTGGLDIRRLLVDVAAMPQQAILGRHRQMKVAFLSVPHHGTNIASFIEENRYRQAIRSLLSLARIGLESNQGSLSDLVAPFLRRYPLNSQLALAVLDALRESDLRAGDERQRAYEREALSALQLWLGHMESDFAAIDDLRAGTPAGSTSPAHFDGQTRAQELARCEENGIRTRSYVTRAPAPATILSHAEIVGALSGALTKATLRASATLARTSATRVPQVARAGAIVFGNLLSAGPGLIGNLWATLPLVPGVLRNASSNLAAALRTGFGDEAADVVFGVSYSMCAYQPFPGRAPLTLSSFDEGAAPATLGPTDSDGIVNSLSMCFADPPAGQPGNAGDHQAVLVDQCDHADIIGHYELQEIPRPNDHGRQYSRYDFFASGTAFGPARFEKVWDDVFSFCT